MNASAQNDFDLIEKEITRLGENHIDNIVVYGSKCVECDGESYGKYYFCYDSSNEIKSRYIVILNAYGDSSIKIQDSVFLCKDCAPVLAHTKSHYLAIGNQLDSVLYIMTPKEKVGKRTYFTMWPVKGPSYFYGIYAQRKFYYTYYYRQYINALFNEGYESWVFFSLLKNQWPEL